MTDTLNPIPTPSFGGHFFTGGTPVYFEGDDGLGAGAPTPAAEVPPAGEPPTGEPQIVDDQASSGGEPEPPASPESDPDDGAIPEPLKPYVTKLREEAAERRVALKPYEEAFGNFEPAEQEALLEVIAGLGTEEGQFEAATRLKGVVDAILEGQDDPDRPLTARDLERREAEKEAKAQEEAAVQAVVNEAKELGYEENSKDYRRLMDLAVNETAGDLKKAHEALTAERDAIIAEYAKQVQEGKAKWPTLAPPPGGTPADPGGHAPKTWAEARHSAQARARAVPGT